MLNVSKFGVNALSPPLLLHHPARRRLPSEGQQGSSADWAVYGHNRVSAPFSPTDEK